MVRLLKSGEWAVEGHSVKELTKGKTVDFGPKENADLVSAGWAEHVEPEPAAEDGKGAKAQGQKPGGQK
jgi:hypothetical protein